MRINFNKPVLVGNELKYIEEAINSGHISGNGKFTKLCQSYFSNRWGFGKTLLTSSCTDSLEMCAILLDIKMGDEIIMPSFTFVSTAIAFIRQGAKIIFCDSKTNQPNIDESKIEELISEKTRAIVVVHYAGVACDMDKISELAQRYNLFVIEDAAQAIDSYYKGTPLGSIGQLGCFSFHETKNIQCGEGGLIAINDLDFTRRAEIIWEKGTNRAEFFRGEINKYGWVDIGSSFLPSEISAAFLYSQLEGIDNIQQKRKKIFDYYYESLVTLEKKNYLKLPFIPNYATNNAHMFYIVCNNFEDRTNLLFHFKKANILAVSHYNSLHKSEYYKNEHDGRILLNSDIFSDCLLRLPLYFEITMEEMDRVIKVISDFYIKN